MQQWKIILISLTAGIILIGCGESKKAEAISKPLDPDVIAYPLDTCLVADKKLGSMGKPHVFIHEKRQIKFCCIGCDDEFNSNTEKYIQKFDQAVGKNKSNTTKSSSSNTNNPTK
tara:strand:- start:677 stop:1021 length:345 start_codon:yes stop_codon:yes gene_type:complete